MVRWVMLISLSIILSCAAEAVQMADKVIVKKSTRMLYLSSSGTIFKRYHVSLGVMPDGAKEIEGDMKTPEGVYILDWRQYSQVYNKSIHISYPNAQDKAKAKEIGYPAGGMIMIHGTPTSWGLSPIGSWMPMLLDWTEGCIAMTNEDMDEMWDLTPDGTPIFILP